MNISMFYNRSLYGETEPIKWIALYRGTLNSQRIFWADGNPEETFIIYIRGSVETIRVTPVMVKR
jgi:hypothetical protein